MLTLLQIFVGALTVWLLFIKDVVKETLAGIKISHRCTQNTYIHGRCWEYLQMYWLPTVALPSRTLGVWGNASVKHMAG